MDHDQRPPLWVGHVFLNSSDVAATAAFLERIGVRNIVLKENLGVFELRGGTHIVLRSGESNTEEVSFDLMVEDLNASHQAYQAMGLEPSEVQQGNIHSCFFLQCPAGNRFRVNSSHAGDRAV